VDSELAQVADNPLAAEFLGSSGGSAGAAEKVGDKVALVG